MKASLKPQLYRRYAVFICFFMTFMAFLSLNAPVFAQTGDQFTAAKVTALEGAVLKSARYNIILWGIEVPDEVDPALSLRARALLDRAIAGNPVQCNVMQWSAGTPRAQCLNSNEQDLAIILLEGGLAHTNREVLFGHSLAQPYFEAEQRATIMRRGLWFDESEAAANILDFANLRPELQRNLFVVIAILAAGPALGLIIVALIMFTGFGRLISMQKNQIAKANKDERDLKAREKFVVASSLEGEVTANKSKVEAFVSIYKELLRDMRNPNKVPKYQQTGDIIHEKPALVRMVYDANINKLEMLGPSLACLLSKLYAEVETNPKYTSLEPDVPLKEAESKVENIIIEAEKMIPHMDKILSGLTVIARGNS